MTNDSRNSIWQMIVVSKRYVRYGHSINHSIQPLLMTKTQNNHAFTDRAMEYGKRMDEIEAHVERQKKLDLANDFSFQARYMRYGHSINHSIQPLLTNNLVNPTNTAKEYEIVMIGAKYTETVVSRARGRDKISAVAHVMTAGQFVIWQESSVSR